MSREKLKHMKDTLMCVVEMQLCEIDEVDTKELGEAIDMIKDLEEAIYYATVTEAMNNPKEIEWEMEEDGHQKKPEDRMYYGYPKMYYADGGYRPHTKGSWKSSEDSWGTERDEREGRSPMSRKMYMEAKEGHKDKATQLRELEKYMQELTQDITDMIADSSAEEKQYLEKKITALATKIGQMK